MTDEQPHHKRTTDALTGETLAKAMPAATVIVFRDSADGQPPQLLVVERSAKMVFAGGAIVFPGGRVDPDDREFAAAVAPDMDVDEAAARIAAIRETLEETGLVIGLSGDQAMDSQAMADMREKLHQGEPFSRLCREAGLKPCLDQLIPFTRWCPPFNEKRIFDTRFYICRDDHPQRDIEVDATENRTAYWAGAQQILDQADQGKVKIIFPTRRNLERLAQFSSFEQAHKDALDHPVRLIMPHIEQRDGQPFLCIPDDLGYPVTSEPLKRAIRR